MPANALCLLLLQLCLLPRLPLLSCLFSCLLCLPAVSESIKCSNFNQLFDNKFHELFKFDGNRNHKLTPFIGVAVGHGQGVMKGKGMVKGAWLMEWEMAGNCRLCHYQSYRHRHRSSTTNYTFLGHGCEPKCYFLMVYPLSSFPLHSLPLSVSTLIPLLVSFMLY